MLSESLRLFSAVLFLFSLLLFSSWSLASGQAVNDLTIRITAAPSSGSGPERMELLKARVHDPEGVCGQGFVNCRVALFSYAGGKWFVQPYLNRQLVEISTNGLVEEEVHLGVRYAALVVFAGRYPAQPENILTLPTRFALTKDEAGAGAQHPDDEPLPVAPLATVAPDMSPRTETLPPASAVSDPLVGQVEPSSTSRVAWARNLFRQSLGIMILVAVLLLALLLNVSGQLKAFSDSLEEFLRELIHIPALRLNGLQAIIKARMDKEEAAKFLAAVFCFVLAIGVALANYMVVKFSFELILPVNEALTTLAAAFVALKGGAGILLHFFESRSMRLAVVVSLIFASGCGMTLAYKRALAIQELSNNSSALSVTASLEEGVKVNEAVLGKLRQAGELTSQANTPAVRLESSVTAWLFSLEAPLVAAINLVMDIFEVLCIYGALYLSAKGVVWAVCLPIQLPVGIGKEFLLLIHRTKLMKVISVLLRASLEAPGSSVLRSKVLGESLQPSLHRGAICSPSGVNARLTSFAVPECCNVFGSVRIIKRRNWLRL